MITILQLIAVIVLGIGLYSGCVAFQQDPIMSIPLFVGAAIGWAIFWGIARILQRLDEVEKANKTKL
jgi:drug/metabolite transporter (DMT)-like permease